MGGFQGRTEKLPDSCYSFWVGGTLAIIGSLQDVDVDSLKTFLVEKCQMSSERGGGFAKHPYEYPDILHTFYSLCALSLVGQFELRPINPLLAVCADR